MLQTGVGDDRRVQIKAGSLARLYPAICIHTINDTAELTLSGGLGYVPITFTGLSSPRGYVLLLDHRPVNKAVHGNDFWQTDYDLMARRWSPTYNIPVRGDTPRTNGLERNP